LGACETFTGPFGGLDVRLTAGADSMVPGAAVPITIVVSNAGFFPIGFEGPYNLGFDVLHPDGTVTGRGQIVRPDWLRRWILAPRDSLVVERTWRGVEGPAGTYRLRPYVDTDHGERRGPAVRIEVLPAARARLVHSYSGLPPLDLVVGDRHAAVAVPPQLASGGGLVATGVQTVEIRPTGSDTPIAAGQYEFMEERLHTFAVREGTGGPELWQITDPDTVVDPRQARLRLIHLAALAPDLAVSLTPPEGADPIALTFPYGVTFSYVSSDSGWWTLVVTAADQTDTLARSRVLLLGGQVRTLLLLDGSAGRILGLLLEP
jgi:hypothetical protein